MKDYGLGEIIIPKKGKIVQGSDQQKMEKKEWKYLNEFLQIESNIPQQTSELGKDISREERDRRREQMYMRLPRHSRSAILKCLKKNRYNMTETYNHMIKQPQMAEDQPQKMQNKEENKPKMLHQACDQFQNGSIKGQELQQVFTVVPSKRKPIRRAASKMNNPPRREQVDEDQMHLTLKEIRDELDHLYKYRQSIQIMKGNTRGHPNIQHQHMINQINPRIATLSRASRILQVQQMEEKNPLFVNLHGYRQQEIFPLFNGIVQMIRTNQQVKSRTKIAELVAITGKGLHSKNNFSALKPVLESWCHHNGFKCNQECDRMILLIPLQ